MDREIMYQVIVDGKMVEATTEKNALYAANFLNKELSDHYGSPGRMLRAETIICVDYEYNSKLTLMARKGQTIA